VAYNYPFGGAVNNTSGFFGFPGYFVYADSYAMPTGNVDSRGLYPIWIHEVAAGYISGNGTAAIDYRGVVTGGNYLFSSSGGTFRFMIIVNAGSINFGRNTANGLTTRNNNNGTTWGGGITGAFNWSTAPAAPTMIAATPGPGGQMTVTFSGSGDTGGQPITGWVLQYATNAAFTTGVVTVASSGTSVLSLTPGVQYWFRAAGRNVVTDNLGAGVYGGWAAAITAKTLAGGSIYDSGAWVPANGQIYDAGAWVPSTGQIYDAGAWVPIG
jgi:hypothetical protein